MRHRATGRSRPLSGWGLQRRNPFRCGWVRSAPPTSVTALGLRSRCSASGRRSTGVLSSNQLGAHALVPLVAPRAARRGTGFRWACWRATARALVDHAVPRSVGSPFRREAMDSCPSGERQSSRVTRERRPGGSCRPGAQHASYSSDNSPRSLRSPRSRSNIASASSTRPIMCRQSTSQNEQGKNAPSRPTRPSTRRRQRFGSGARSPPPPAPARWLRWC